MEVDDHGLLIHEPDPIQAEGRSEALPLTPVDKLFRRDNLPPPPPSDGWELALEGVANPATFTVPDLVEALRPVDMTAVLQCAGNGRGLLADRPSGTPWGTGAAANLRWSGVAVADLVDLAGGANDGARFLTALGADAAPDDPKRVERSVPLHAGVERGVLAFGLNGEPLPTEHGGPVRLVIPGYFAVNSVKWVVTLALTAEESDAEIQTLRYRLTQPGAVPAPNDPSCWEMPVKSWVTSPDPGAVVSPTVEVEGVAFSGAGTVTTVEVTADGGKTWQHAVLGPSAGPASWRTFSATLELGDRGWKIASRAHDSSGSVQPARSNADRNGYAVNGWLDHTVAVSVEPTFIR
jgi:DMSO/TMAO reductase YedYZ molybdopterin-dependent catalytic subunit